MESKTVERLLKLNREFYGDFASSFSGTRSHYGGEIERILPYLREQVDILDMGCGNGRVFRLLEEAGHTGRYVGVDSSSELITIAKEHEREPQPSENIQSQFICLDIVHDLWIETLNTTMGERRTFGAILLLAVLHHIPTRRLREKILFNAADLLDPNGILIVSNWQFVDNERMRRKIIDPVICGFSKEELDEDDYFLDWKRDGYGIRYCHLIRREELIQAAGPANLKELTAFRAGGREGNLSEIIVMGRTSRPISVAHDDIIASPAF